ncbi:MAG: metallopeptidase TldD-related protein [Burkholderiales bacterium]|nr:metallopeptidase TldD-related protein [Burkholderiales bacterium]
MRALFDTLAEVLDAQAGRGELLVATLEAEASEFVRLNNARVRQAGRLERAVARLRLVDGDRQASCSVTLPGLGAGRDAVAASIADAVLALRAAVADSEPDPLLDVNQAPVVSDDDGPDAPFDRTAFVDAVAQAAGDADLVGFCAAGPVARGFCSSSGSRQWYRRSSVAFDWSIHLPDDAGTRRAVKASWSGTALDTAAIAAAIARSRADASVLARPVRRLSPGDYRVLLAPRALGDLLEMFGWGGFSARSHRTGQSPLGRLARGEVSMSPMLSIVEDLDAGFAPAFQSDGYPRPWRVPLIEGGRLVDTLVSPRTAREFGLVSNSAADHESPESMCIAPGALRADEALARLGTGVSVSNLWYLNWSDRAAGRVTGMTRFASLWVEDGEPVDPIEAMRFDDVVHRILGESLEALGDTPLRMPSTDTWDSRATGGLEAPSALVSALRFAL